MKIKNIDTYLTSTKELLESNPNNTTISITYTHVKKNDNKVRSIIKFKTFNNKSGIVHIFKTHKSKEFSKIINALGPRGCNINGNDMDGLSLSLSNVNKNDIIKEDEKLPIVEEQTVNNVPVKNNEQSTSQKKKKNKKKGKK
ncbi:signal recognition particle subunit [Pichia kluyveri]|uniref:Signal recognition particle subunit n=1 Tax=Pichia kluyveri TaxID=36015 RepID=A0AAV5R6A4_PICKL|nr:signal recognition particle subunit [Pichia kluyveri]